MLTRIQELIANHSKDFAEDLNLDDEDSNGYLPMEQIWKVWKINMIPIDEELTEFFELMALRCSISLKKVNYKDLILIFEEG